MTVPAGARIALVEARLASELAELVRREGGAPVCAPAVAEEPVNVAALLPSLVADMESGRCEIVVLLTGAGLTAMLHQAQATGVHDAFTTALARTTTVCRGPKPATVLRRIGVPVRINARSPHTTAELLEALPAELVRDKGVLLVHDGGGNPVLVAALRARGANVQEVRSYEWRLPDDLAPVESLVEELIEGRIDAIAFTSQVQILHLFEVGRRMNRSEALLYALRHRTIVGSIGPTCSRALVEFGVPPHVEASPPKMRPLVTAIGAHLANRPHHATNEGSA